MGVSEVCFSLANFFLLVCVFQSTHVACSQSPAISYTCILVVNSTSPSAQENCSCPSEGNTAAVELVVCVDLSSALRALTNSTQVIIEEPHHQNLSVNRPPPSIFHGLHDISIEAGGSFNVSVTCDEGIGLNFTHTTGVLIKGLEFQNCGAIHNSTSRDYNVSNTFITFMFLQFKAALYFESCQDVSFQNVTVSGTDGIGLVLYGTLGTNTFEHCNFLNNSVWDELTPGGGGVYIEFPYCVPGNPDYCDVSPYMEATYLFTGCSFSGNIAYSIHPVEYPFFFPQHLNHLSLGRGGGLCIYFSNARNISVGLEECHFSNNQAVWGGGLFAEFQGGSEENVLTVNHTTFVNNKVSLFTQHPYKSDPKLFLMKTGGGGARIGFVFPQEQPSRCNRVKFYESHFDGNEAYWGGGVSVGAVREKNVINATSIVKFDSCTWQNNHGRIGAAVELSLLYQATSGSAISPTFEHCLFQNNKDLSPKESDDSKSMYMGGGVVTANGLSTSFSGETFFLYNKRTALVAEDAIVRFYRNSAIYFTENTGHNGGAIGLWGYTFIVLYKNSSLAFRNNHAYRYGGAISVLTYSRHVSNVYPNCFIQYEDIGVEPWLWDTHLYFVGNIEGHHITKSNAISATSLESCFWDGWGPPDPKNKGDRSNVPFCWNDTIWHFEEDCSDQITSAPGRFDKGNEMYEMRVVPGVPTLMPIEVYGDLKRNRTDSMVVNVWSKTPDTLTVPDASVAISDRMITLYGKENTTGSLVIETWRPRSIGTEINVTILPCPPGFDSEPVESSSGHEICRCSKHPTFLAKVVCAGSQPQLKTGWWIGYITKDNGLITMAVGLSPFMPATNLGNGYVMLPSDVSQLNNHLCGIAHGKGVLCSKCEKDYGFAGYSIDQLCVPCNNGYLGYVPWMLYFVVQLVPIALFIFILWFCAFKATVGWANAFIFYAQMITTVFRISIEGNLHVLHALRDIYIAVYDIWNLNFLRGIWPNFCLSQHLDYLDILMLDYTAAFFPLFLVLILFFINRKYPLPTTSLSAVVTFLVLSYTKIAIISVSIIQPSVLFDKNGTKAGVVPFYNGELPYFRGKHIAYVLVAVVLSVVFLLTPALLLIVYPFANQLGLRKPKEWILKVTRQKLHLFLFEFYGCYKDCKEEYQRQEESSCTESQREPHGVKSRDYRFTAGLYFLLRVLILIAHASTNTWMQALVFQQIIIIVTILYFSILRPYSEDWHNSLDALTFTVLGAINTITIYHLLLSVKGKSLSQPAFTVQYILVFLPLVWMIGILFWRNRENITLDKLKQMFQKMKKSMVWNSGRERGQVTSTTVTIDTTSIGESTRDNDLTNSLRYTTGQPQNHQPRKSFSWTGTGPRARARLSTGRPTGYSLVESRRATDRERLLSINDGDVTPVSFD